MQRLHGQQQGSTPVMCCFHDKRSLQQPPAFPNRCMSDFKRLLSALQGKDHTLFALVDGRVVFSRSRHTGRRSVSVTPTPPAPAPPVPTLPPSPRIPTHLLRAQRQAARAAAAGARSQL